jgi:hypothetical protein
MFEAAKLGERLLVGVNSDDGLAAKRQTIHAILNARTSYKIYKWLIMRLRFDDSDGSASDAIRYALKKRPWQGIILPMVATEHKTTFLKWLRRPTKQMFEFDMA